jgi:hypothetical protein
MGHEREKPANRFPGLAAPALPRRLTCAVGDTLCEVRVLTEAEWDALPAEERPSPAEHYLGLGWVVATPGHAPKAGDVPPGKAS